MKQAAVEKIERKSYTEGMLAKKISSRQPYIIAEIGMNHDGNFALAKKLVAAARKTGVNAVKFQMHIAEEETLPNAPTPPYFRKEKRFDYFRRTAFSISQWKELRRFSKKIGTDFIVSPFSIKAAQVSRQIGVDALKIASGEVTNLPLLKFIASTKIPALLSSGMSDWREIARAVKVLKKNLVALLQCSSQYPCSTKRVGLNVVAEMKKRYPRSIIGFSDHTLDNSSSIAALVLGARVFEKHFTTSKKLYGPDARFSLEPDQMLRYVEGLKFVAESLSHPVDKNDLREFRQMKRVFEKSIVAARPLPAGHKLCPQDLCYKKPGTGLRADRVAELLNKVLAKPLRRDQMLKISHIRR